MNLKLETEFSKAPILQEIDALKKQIDDMRPLSPEIEGRVMQKLRLDWNYNSNAIEGNKLSYGETTALLMHGITAKGKPLKDHLDLKGHNEAIGYLDRIIKDGRSLTETDIRGLHQVILIESYDVKAQTSDGLPTTKTIQIGKYKSSDNHVETITGEIHYYTPFQETPAKMGELMDWYYAMIQDTTIHPVITAALLHYKFVAIHPFDDGNGRLARILMNLVLMQNGFPPVVLKKDDKQNYYALLSQGDAGEFFPFVAYIAELLKSSLSFYLKAMNGDDIDEDEDIDKEIALFKMELRNEVRSKERKSLEVINRFIEAELISLLYKLNKKSMHFEEFFFSSYVDIKSDTVEGSSFYFELKNDFEEYASQVKNKNKLLSEIEVKFGYGKFKNPDNDFDVVTSLRFSFNEYSYNIKIFNDEEVTTKLYHENLTNEDLSKIIKEFVNNIKGKIKAKL